MQTVVIETGFYDDRLHTTAFGFVFIHLSDGGNRRNYSFLFHHVLSSLDVNQNVYTQSAVSKRQNAVNKLENSLNGVQMEFTILADSVSC